MLDVAVGDIHGCLIQLLQLLEKCRRYADGRPTRYIFLGDYIDRGPDSAGVVDLIMTMQASDPDNVIALAGNHEDFLRKLDRPADIALWLENGGDDTLASYGTHSITELPRDHLRWLRGLRTHLDDGKRFFVHAGIRPGVPLDRQIRDDMLWIREPFLSWTGDFERRVVHGHSPVSGTAPDIRSNRINLDTGAFYSGALTAAVFLSDESEPIAILQTRPTPR